MQLDKMHIRHCLLFLFHCGKSAADSNRSICQVYGNDAVSARTCRGWFRKFESGKFDLNDKPRTGRPEVVDNKSIQYMLDKDATQTTMTMAESLGVHKSSISRHLKAMGKIRKVGKWVPHHLTDANKSMRLHIANTLLQRQKRKSFLSKIVTGDEKWVFLYNSVRRHSWVDPGQPSTSTVKKDIHGKKPYYASSGTPKEFFIMNF